MKTKNAAVITSNAFTTFAEDVCRIYHSHKKNFWQIMLAPFLSYHREPGRNFETIRIQAQTAMIFSGMEKNRRQILKEFSRKNGFHMDHLKSNRIRYFQDAYPVFAFLAIWLYENKLSEILFKFDEILKAAVFAVSGYGILDYNVDSDTPVSVEVLISELMLLEYESLLFSIFGSHQENHKIIHMMKRVFLQAEITEKEARWKRCPYELNHPEQLGAKGANTAAPFLLCLEKLGRKNMIEKYWNVFLLFGAAIQMIDDWDDLSEDLASGHFSYVTLGFEHRLKKNNDIPALVDAIRNDKTHVHTTYENCKKMLLTAKRITEKLDDPILLKLVDVTAARVETFYGKEFSLRIDRKDLI